MPNSINDDTSGTRIMVESKPTAVQIKQALFENLRSVLAFAILFGMLSAIIIILNRQQNNTATLHDVQTTNTRLIDCTTPGHTCYDDGQKRTGQVVEELNKVQKAIIIAAAHCASIGYSTVPALTKCVNNSLK